MIGCETAVYIGLRLQNGIATERIVIEFLLTIQCLIRVAQDKPKQADHVRSSD